MLQKAYICPYRDGRPVLGKRFYVQFNPSELSIDEAIGVSETDENATNKDLEKSSKNGTVGWQRPLDDTMARKRKGMLTLSTTLFFNTLNDLYQNTYEDVRKYVSRLYPYTNKKVDNTCVIEQIYFFWGSIAVAGTLERMQVNYVMFAPDGKPVRAQVGISIVGDYIGDESYDFMSGEVTGREAAGDEAGIMAEDPSRWREHHKSKKNPRL